MGGRYLWSDNGWRFRLQSDAKNNSRSDPALRASVENQDGGRQDWI